MLAATWDPTESVDLSNSLPPSEALQVFFSSVSNILHIFDQQSILPPPFQNFDSTDFTLVNTITTMQKETPHRQNSKAEAARSKW